MDQLWMAVLTTACTVAASLVVTYLFNKISGLPKRLGEEKKAREEKIKALDQKNAALETKNEELNTKIDTFNCELRELISTNNTVLDTRLGAVEEAVSHYPEYRAQSLAVQKQLKEADSAIVDLCKEIKEDVVANRTLLNERLASLERREKNSLRAKILAEWRLYMDAHKNPMKAWTEMEHHSFFKLVEDYEDLGGNDYVHHTILPDMNTLDIVPMDQLDRIKDLYNSRNIQ